MKNIIVSEVDRLHTLNEKLAENQLSKIEDTIGDTHKFKKRGNEEQFKQNNKVLVKLQEAESSVAGPSMNNDRLILEENIQARVTDSEIAERSKLYDLSGRMAQFLLASESDNTSKLFFNGFRRWENFIRAQGHESIPAQPVHVALYITHLLDSGATYSSVNLAVYSIKWAHNLRGATDPTENAFVKNLREARPQKRRKDPVSSEMLIKLCEIFEDSNDLLVIRDLCMILICFQVFYAMTNSVL
ncbi:hypothetical protein FSP39_023639 [Pinctada imbricata]|uniref:Uncharacterized protein n=1 Tax=Pinctada imbricata TaxID=66713 RepID=A0AA88YG25_PINIB|nr:hypothetical protein FSP39_023639 [Pinctada imbricata]